MMASCSTRAESARSSPQPATRLRSGRLPGVAAYADLTPIDDITHRAASPRPMDGSLIRSRHRRARGAADAAGNAQRQVIDTLRGEGRPDGLLRHRRNIPGFGLRVSAWAAARGS